MRRSALHAPLYAYNVDMAQTLGTFEQAALVSVLKLGGQAYGRSVLREIERRLARDVSAGAAYATLNRLEARGLLRARLAEGTPERGGRARRFYTLTSDGRAALRAARATAVAMWHGIRLTPRVPI